MGKRRGRPRGRGVADREAPAAGNLRVTRQTSKMMQCGSSRVAKEMVLLGTDNVPLTLLDPSTVPPQSEAPAADNLKVNRRTSKLVQCASSKTSIVAKEGGKMVLLGTNDVPSPILVTSAVPPNELVNSSVRSEKCSYYDAEREQHDIEGPEFNSQNENCDISHVHDEQLPEKMLSVAPNSSVDNELKRENIQSHRSASISMTQISQNSLVDEDNSSTVEGYRVRPEYVPVLRLIFAKYGDIAKNSDLQSLEILSHFLEMACSIILKLQRSNFREVTCFQVARMLAKIQDLESVKFNVGWLRNKLEDIQEKKMLDNKYSELQEEKAKIEGQKKLLESCEADLAALQAEVLLFQQDVKEMTNKYEEGTREFSKMKHRFEDAYEKDLVDGLL